MTPLEQAIQTFVTALLGLLTVLIGYLVVIVKAKFEEWLKTKIGAEKLATVKSLADTVVHALEQTNIWNQLDGPAKKAQAMAWLSQQISVLGIKMTPEEISNIIEESVHKMNMATTPILTEATIGTISKP